MAEVDVKAIVETLRSQNERDRLLKNITTSRSFEFTLEQEHEMIDKRVKMREDFIMLLKLHTKR